MTGFFIGGAIALALALLLVLRPFVWQRARATASHKQLNAAIHRDQLNEIERDRAAGTLAEEDYVAARDELQRRVLEDGQDDEAAPTLKAPKKTLIGLALIVPAAAVGLYVLIGHPEGINPVAQHQVTDAAIEGMVNSLAAKMEKDPNNVEGWGMLGRSYKVIGKIKEAEKAFEHAIALNTGDAQVYAEYADVLAMKAGGNLAGKPTELIEKALKLDPNNPQTLWLAGTAAFDAGRFSDAVATWTRLQGLLPPGSEDARQIAGAIAEARSKGGMPAAAPVAAAAVDATKAVRGRVELAASVKANASPDDTVMVLAREAGGPKMPIAIQRLRVADLPADFALDDSMAMMPPRTISSVAAVEIEARVTKSGQAMPQPGDLYSAVQQAKAGKSGMKLVIDQVRK